MHIANRLTTLAATLLLLTSVAQLGHVNVPLFAIGVISLLGALMYSRH